MFEVLVITVLKYVFRKNLPLAMTLTFSAGMQLPAFKPLRAESIYSTS